MKRLGGKFRRGRLVAALLPLACCAIAQAEPSSEPAAQQVMSLAGRTMGTTYHVKCWGGAESRSAVQPAIEKKLEQFDRQMSTWRPDSEVSQFNHSAGREWRPVSAELAYVVRRALEFQESTEGTLDISVAPLLRVWGFGPEALKNRSANAVIPSTDEIRTALKSVGRGQIKVREHPPALWKAGPAVQIELSAIAPGYAVDLLLEQLHQIGFPNAMVEIGGEVRATGRKPDGSRWQVGVEKAGDPAAEFVRIVALDGRALTTAGDYRNFSGGGKTGRTHVIDPRNGQALPVRNFAVTVLTETCIDADALDTALLVLGPERGYEWCVKHEVAALFQLGVEKPRLRTTPKFDELAPLPTAGR